LAEEIRIRLTADGNAKVEIDKVEKELGQLQKTVKSTGQTFKNVFETAAGVAIGQGLVGAFKLAGRGARELFNVFQDGVAAAQVQEDAIQKLNTALAQSGQFSVEASESLQEYASALQATTKFGDEAILNAQALLQSLGRLDQEGLKEATTASLDLAAALGISLESAVTLVGKAAAGEIGTFSRYGVIIERGSDNAETFANTLETLNRQFGGAASAQVQTFSGAVAQAGNSFGDFTEELGFVVTQNAAINTLIQESSKIFQELGKAVEDNRAELQALATQGILFLIDGIDLAVVGLEKLINAFQNTRKFALSVQATFASLLGDDAVEQLIVDDIAAIQKQQDATASAFDTTRKKIEEFQERIKASGEESSKSQELLNMKLIEQSKAAAAAAANVNTLTKEQIALGAAGAQLAQQLGATGTLADQVKADTVALQEAREAQLITDEEFFQRRQALLAEDFAARQQLLQEAKDQELITEQQFNDASLASQQKLTADIAKNEMARTAFEEKEAQRRLNAQKEALGGIATLQSSNNKTLFNIGKAAALAQATIDGISSIQKTAAAFPFPFNIPFVAAATAAQAANIAKIASAKPPGLQGGIDEVPPGFNNDTFPALLSSGERVVPAQTNQDLTSFLAGNSAQTPLLESINNKLDNLGAVTVNVGGEQITEVVRRELESGGTLAVEA
jgi:hypothetical protein